MKLMKRRFWRRFVYAVISKRSGYLVSTAVLPCTTNLALPTLPMRHVGSRVVGFLAQFSQYALKCPEQLPQQVTLRSRRLSLSFQIRNQLALICNHFHLLSYLISAK